MFSAVNHPVSDTTNFVHIRQNSLLTVDKMGQQSLHGFVMIGERCFVQKGFVPLRIMLKDSVGHADTVRLTLSQDAVVPHLKEFVFER